ncbi:NAD-P-binding protein [Collybia nuda]|uniref:NAD-P-binding protein n=1 Tax=Collybia nuda TaxID=64659 RepID=A0A9P5Y474_9AGAR|nr:NAD-P-binding protein [Collybia nuda]
MGGTFSAQLTQYWPPKPKWWQNDIPDLTGRVMVVTGGKSGVGKETVKALLQHNAKVYLAARGKEDAEKVIKELKTITGKEAIFLELDLASLPSVRKAAEEFLSKEPDLHVLFNNAGLMWPSLDLLTEQGYDAQWGVHVVEGTHLFATLLMPALLAGTKSSKDGKARIVTTSSSGAYLDHIHWDTFVPGPARTKLGTNGLYCQSKFAQVAWTQELVRRYGDKNILCLALNPGNVRSGLQRHQSALLLFFVKMVLNPVDPYGPLTQLYGGTSPDCLHKDGAFLIPWAREGLIPPGTTDPALGAKLWEYLENEVKTKGVAHNN